MFRFALTLACLMIWAISSVHSQAEGPPTCAIDCISSFVSLAGCDLQDPQCFCFDTSQGFDVAVTNCVAQNCNVTEAYSLLRYSTTTCNLPTRNDGPFVRGMTWALWSLALTAVLFRFLVRFPGGLFKGNGYGLDDYTLLLALIFLTPIVPLVVTATQHGLGKDLFQLTPEQITYILRFLWVREFSHILTLDVTRISTLLLYLRIWTRASTQSPTFRRCCFILIGLLTAHAIAFVVSLACQCTPIRYFWVGWDGSIQGRCIDYTDRTMALGGFNFFFDLVIYTLPVSMLVKLHMPLRKKVGVSLLFAAGLSVTGCSVVGLVKQHELSQHVGQVYRHYDSALRYNIVECCLSVICACLPALAGLFSRLWKFVTGQSCKGSGTYATERAASWRDNSRSIEDYGDDVRLSSLQPLPLATAKHREVDETYDSGSDGDDRQSMEAVGFQMKMIFGDSKDPDAGAMPEPKVQNH